MKKICVYTCITGDYDNLNEIKNKEPGIDYYCFTNNKKIKSDSWNIIYIEDNQLDNTRLARKIKVLGYPEIMDKYEISVWVDGFISEMHVMDFINEKCQLEKYNFVCFKHSKRDCIYDEAEECIRQGKDNVSIIKEEMKFLKKSGYPKKNGLVESTVLIRKHNNPIVKETMKIWFDMILEYSKRDQLSLNYAIYQTGIDVQFLDMNVFDNNYFKFAKHNLLSLDRLYTVYYNCGDGFSEKDRNDLLYLHSKDNLIIKLKLKFDVCGLRIDLCETQGAFLTIRELKNIDINDIEFIDWININNEYISLSDPQLIINHTYKKNEEIYLAINLKLMPETVVNDIAFKIIERQNTELNKLKAEIQELKCRNLELTNKEAIISEKYNDIINSRKWKIVSKISFRNK